MKKLIFIALMLFLITGCTATSETNKFNEKNAPDELADNNEKKTTPIPPIPPTTPPASSQENIKTNEATKNMNKAKIKTSLGEIIIKLDQENAPISTENFKNYANNEYFNGTLFHRVMPGFMIQCGGFDSDKNQKKTEEPIKNEATNGLKNDRGTLAMARTNVVDSATSQFFINLVDNDFLNYQNDANYGYAVFGEVTEGMDVVDAIAKVKTGNNGGHQNWPEEDVVIESVELFE